jgi:hypothetical protein
LSFVNFCSGIKPTTTFDVSEVDVVLAARTWTNSALRRLSSVMVAGSKPIFDSCLGMSEYNVSGIWKASRLGRNNRDRDTKITKAKHFLPYFTGDGRVM